MKISLITPAGKLSKNGNRTSAVRWAGFLRAQGHRMRISVDYHDEPADLMIALHAWRSAGAVQQFRALYPGRPLVVALGGTDVNSFLKTDPKPTLASMKAADALICLHDLIGRALPAPLRKKLHVIKQSAQPLTTPRRPSQRHFDICVIGHLRGEKDPFRTALAARQLPNSSRLRVIHLGSAHEKTWADQARAEMAHNPRYHWHGEVPGWRVRREFAKTHLMVISSVQEGGANVVSEALAAKVPVIASDIDGNVGLLGQDYPGYYPVGDEGALAKLLRQAETEPRFLKSLEAACRKLAPQFTPKREAAGWKAVIKQITA
jgi:putative glycosyltransferase (TIGR04348 family)